MSSMQFGVFSTGFLPQDPPLTGPVVHEHETIRHFVDLAVHAEEVGLDVFAVGEHHNNPFFTSSPAVALSHIAARTNRILLSTSMSLITTNDPVRLAEEYALLQHLADGRLDVMFGRGNTAPVYPWFGKHLRDGVELALENYNLVHRLWREDTVDWEGKFRTALQGFTSVPRPLDSVPPFVWHASIRSPEIAEQAAFYGNGLFANNIFVPASHFQRLVGFYRERFEHYGHGTAAQAIVGLGGQAFIRKNSQDALEEFRPHFAATSFGRGSTLEDYIAQTPLMVGSPQQVIDRYADMRNRFGDYHRQLFLLDLPTMTVDTARSQLDELGAIIPTLRAELGRGRPADVPDAPTHPRLVATNPRHTPSQKEESA